VNEVMDDEAQLKCMKRELHALRKLLQEKETQVNFTRSLMELMNSLVNSSLDT
jgi:hypothetical protein